MFRSCAVAWFVVRIDAKILAHPRSLWPDLVAERPIREF
jgi:hypothetical protein